jgi:hypothetical protein
MIRNVLIALLVSVSLLASGCSGANNATQTSVDTSRELACQTPPDGGNPGAPPPPPPIGGPLPPPPFAGGCLSFYQFDFDATLPSGRDVTGPGNLTIFNKDCGVDGSDVMVRFMFRHVPVDKRALFVPGTLNLTDTGATVTGDTFIKLGDDKCGVEVTEKYVLTLTGDPADQVNQTIAGTLFIERHHWFIRPDGKKIDKDLKWNFIINGTGAVPPPPPPPPPPGGGDPGNNPPPPPPPGGGDPGNNPPPLPPDDGGGNG